MSGIQGPRYDLIERNNAASSLSDIERSLQDLGRVSGKPATLRNTHAGSTHWLGDDGYPACWREHRACAEERVARLETANAELRAGLGEVLRHIDRFQYYQEPGSQLTDMADAVHAVLTRVGN